MSTSERVSRAALMMLVARRGAPTQPVSREQHMELFYIKTKVNPQILFSVIDYKEDIFKIPLAQKMYLSSVNLMIGYNFL